MQAFRRTRRGYVATVSGTERTLVAQVVADVVDLLADGAPTPLPADADLRTLASHEEYLDALAGVPPTDPAVARLLPDASHDDAAVVRDFRRLAREDVRAAKLAGLRLLRGRLLAAPPGFGTDDLVALADDAPRLAAALTDVRLVLAERLGLRTDADAEALHARLGARASRRATDEQRHRRAVGELYDALTWLQETLVVAMTADLPDGPVG